jgi:drug/metabolite transporter (DMT)-like permease
MTDEKTAGLSPAWTAAASALFIFFWASGFISAKYGFPYAEPFTFLTLRFVVALAVLVPLMRLWRVAWPAGPRTFAHLAVAGLMAQTAYLIGVFYGIYLGISTGVMALLVGLQPLVTGALAAPVLGERVAPRQWLGLTLGFAGLGLVVAEKVNVSAGEAGGVAFGALALAGITLGTLYQKRFCATVDVRATVTVQNAVSLAVIAPLAATVETMRIDWTGEFLFALLWSAIGLSVIAIALYYLLVRHGAAARVTSLIYLSPPTTALMGWLMFEETFAPPALAGMAIAVAGVALANRR